MDTEQQKQLENSGSLEFDETQQPSPSITPLPVSEVPVAPPPTDSPLATPDSPDQKPKKDKVKLSARIRKLFERLNIYLFMLALIVLLIAGATFYTIQHGRKSAKDSALNTKTLTAEDFAKLSDSSTTVGDAKQTLNIESNTIFAGSLLVRNSVDIAGSLKVGGSLSLKGINVDGGSTLDQIQTKTLSVSGDATIQGKVNIQNNLTVTGKGTFSGALSAGQLTVDSLQLNQDLVLSRHINASGSTPGRTNGSALGSGGTSTVSGADTAGTVTINTGNSAPAGCFITVSFATDFSATPHVVISPVGSAASALDYYVNRTATGFSVCTSSDPPDNTASIIFDYVAID